MKPVLAPWTLGASPRYMFIVCGEDKCQSMKLNKHSQNYVNNETEPHLSMRGRL